MKTLITVFFIVTLFCISCKKSFDKLPEETQQDLVVLAMTSGTWEMTWFKENGVSIPDFNGYEFKYYSNYTVDALFSSTSKQGTWGGSASTMTTTANFPASAGMPLQKINGTWKILRNSWTYVEAEQVVDATLTKTMRLQKK